MKGQHEDLKWFGEGFDGFPKHLPDDCVQYALYIIDSKPEESTVRARLRQIQQAANALTRRLLIGFIWQREPFNLELVQENGSSLLRGQTNYGDSVEDEWLILYILRELSKQFPDAWIHVVDTDGEFLLIEAANVLPPWLNPEVAEYRVWINEGKLLILPIQDALDKVGKRRPQRKIDLVDALRFIQGNRTTLIHSTLIEAEAFHRLEKYPQQIEESLHHSIVTVPRKLAFILHEKPTFISPAAEAFYLRDSIALRPLQIQDTSKLVFPPYDLVKVSVNFTKVGYAQLKSQKFPTPSAWESYFSTGMDQKAYGRTEMGMKIACGFEMLLSDPQNIDDKSVREINLLLGDLQTEEVCLPSDTEISNWGTREDDEGWLDIDFESFASELAGKGDKAQARTTQGFGDKIAQDNLRKIVERFEDFLNDDNAGAEGAENLDEMDDDDDEYESDSESEDQDVSFDEDQFASMMREMMGMPADTATAAYSDSQSRNDADDMHGSDLGIYSVDENEGLEIRQTMEAMEAELEDAGALHHYSKRSPEKPPRPKQSTKEEFPSCTVPADESDIDDSLDIDYNLAKNLLESFKSQGGASGPGGNLMGLMGINLPRDEDDSQ